MLKIRDVAKTTLRHAPPLYRLAANMTNPASEGRRLHAARKTIEYDVRTRLLRKPTVAPIGQRSRIIAMPGESNSPHAAYRNPPNAPEMFVWRDYLRGGDWFIDVGANVGIYTIYACDLGARVIACEPDPRAHARLMEHIELNRYEVEVHQVAVSDGPGKLHLTQGLDSNNHVVLDETDADVITVPAVTLDSILRDRSAAGMKIDVEGAERLVIAGARQALTEQRIGLIQLEFTTARSENVLHEDRSSVATLLRDAGYAFYRPRRDGSLRALGDDVQPGRDVFAATPSVVKSFIDRD